MFANFVHIACSLSLQEHGNPSKPILDPTFDDSKIAFHPNNVMLNVPSYSSVLILWRGKSWMDNPMHLHHGHKIEMLAFDLLSFIRKRECSSKSKCNYQASSNTITWLPKDYPSCDTPFFSKAKRGHPAFHCYDDNDALLGRSLTSSNHHCSHDHL